MIEVNKTYYENCLVTMDRMDPGMVDLTVTSPPYDKLRTYHGYCFEFEETANGLLRVTAPGGVVVWIVTDGMVNGGKSGTSLRQALFFQQIGFRIHDYMVYQKRNFSHPGKTRYHNTWEFMFIFSKGAPKTFNPLMDRKNITAGQIGNKGVNSFTLADGSKSVRAKKIVKEYGMRHNVWLGNTRGQEEGCQKLPNPAMMPKWVAKDHILSWSNEGNLVYDPFGGSGTTGQQAALLKRNYILSEISTGYGK